MSTPEYADAWVDQAFPYDGPHSPTSVVAAAEAVAQLVRYLANATRTVHLPAPDLSATLRDLGVAVSRYDQVIRQLGDGLRFLDEHPEHGELYSDTDNYTPGELVGRIRADLLDGRARANVEGLRFPLDNAANAASHLGHRYDPSTDPDNVS